MLTKVALDHDLIQFLCVLSKINKGWLADQQTEVLYIDEEVKRMFDFRHDDMEYYVYS